MAPRVVLVGAPGAGKTTVGRLLAARLGVAFRDTDADVEAVAGQSVQDVFVDHGEEHFRELERAAVATALQEHEGVLALGGGAVLDAGTRALLLEQPTVWLQVGIADGAKRVGLDVPRPLLLGNTRSRLIRLLEERAPLYSEVARLVVVTDGLTPDEVADSVVSGLSLETAP